MTPPERSSAASPPADRSPTARLRRFRGFLLVAAALLVVGIFLPRACRTPLLARGTAVPAFDLPRVDGPGRVSLESLRGHRAVLFFWAVWCPASSPAMSLQ